MLYSTEFSGKQPFKCIDKTSSVYVIVCLGGSWRCWQRKQTIDAKGSISRNENDPGYLDKSHGRNIDSK